VRAALNSIERFPQAHATLLRALDELLTPPEIVVVRGEANALEPWRHALQTGYEPHRLSFAIPNDASLPGLLATREIKDTPVAYMCSGMTCRAPITTLAELEKALTPGA